MNVLAEMMLSEPAPLAIWVTLLLAATASVVVLAGVDGVRDPHLWLVDAVPVLRRRRAERAQRREEAAHVVRYAGELIVASGRAARAATRWSEHCRRSEENTAAAWRAWRNAEHRLTALRVASAFDLPAARTPAEYADRERFLLRQLDIAIDRGDLPATARTEALAGAGEWNARLHPVEQERAVQRAGVAHLRRRHQRAVMAEKAARHDERLAHATHESLRRETALAVERAAAVRHLVPAPRPGTVPQPRGTVLVPA